MSEFQKTTALDRGRYTYTLPVQQHIKPTVVTYNKAEGTAVDVDILWYNLPHHCFERTVGQAGVCTSFFFSSCSHRYNKKEICHCSTRFDANALLTTRASLVISSKISKNFCLTLVQFLRRCAFIV